MFLLLSILIGLTCVLIQPALRSVHETVLYVLILWMLATLFPMVHSCHAHCLILFYILYVVHISVKDIRKMKYFDETNTMVSQFAEDYQQYATVKKITYEVEMVRAV